MVLHTKKNEKVAECPVCHGIGKIGTTDWLTKHLSAKQLAEEKMKAVAEYEQNLKNEVAKEIFAEICFALVGKGLNRNGWESIDELKKKYLTE